MTARENYLMVYQHKTPKWLPNGLMDKNFCVPLNHIERYMGTDSGEDAFGVHWTYEAMSQAPMPTPGKILLEDITEWQDVVKIPNLELYDWETAGKEYLQKCDPSKVNYALNVNGMFERLHACMGMTEALCALVTDPEACYDFFGAIADHKIRMMEKTKKHFDIEIYNMHDDYGMQDGPFMSIELWRTLLKPHLKRIVEACHDFGMYYQHHSCGFIEPIVDDMVEIGVDAIDTWQICNTNMRAIKDKYQDRLAFVGGLDNLGVLDKENVTPEEVEIEFKRAIDLMAPGGSYIPYPVTLNRFFVPGFLKTMQTYGTDFYQNHPEAIR